MSFYVFLFSYMQQSRSLYGKLLQYVIANTFKNSDYIKYICVKESATSASRFGSANNMHYRIFIWFVQVILLNLLRQATFRKCMDGSIALVSLEMIEDCLFDSDNLGTNIDSKKTNQIVDILRVGIFDIFSSASSEILKSQQFVDVKPSIQEYVRILHLRGENYANLLDQSVLENLFSSISKRHYFVSERAASSKIDLYPMELVNRLMEIPVFFSIVSANFAKNFFFELLMKFFSIRDFNVAEHVSSRYLKNASDSSAETKNGLSLAHWFTGNLISFMTLLSHANEVDDNCKKLYLLLCNVLIRKINFPGILNGRSGVLIVNSKTGGKGISSAVGIPILLQAQIYSLYDVKTIKFLITEYFQVISDSFPNFQGTEKDLKQINDSFKSNGYRMMSTQLQNHQKISSSILARSANWASKLLTSISGPESSASSTRPKKSSSGNLNIDIITLLCDLWSIVFIPTGSFISIASLPWQCVSTITHSTQIISILWKLFISQISGDNYVSNFSASSYFHPCRETSTLGVLLAFLNIKFLTMDDGDIYENNVSNFPPPPII